MLWRNAHALSTCLVWEKASALLCVVDLRRWDRGEEKPHRTALSQAWLDSLALLFCWSTSCGGICCPSLCRMLPTEKAVLLMAWVKCVSWKDKSWFADTAAMCHLQGPEHVRCAAAKGCTGGCFLHVCTGGEGQSCKGVIESASVCAWRRDSWLFFLLIPHMVGNVWVWKIVLVQLADREPLHLFWSGSLCYPQALSCLLSFVSFLVCMTLWLCLHFHVLRMSENSLFLSEDRFPWCEWLVCATVLFELACNLPVAIQPLVSHSLLLLGWCGSVTCRAVLLRHTLVPQVSEFGFKLVFSLAPSMTRSCDSTLCSIFGFYLSVLTPFQGTKPWRFEPRQPHFSGGRLWSLALEILVWVEEPAALQFWVNQGPVVSLIW